jgi:hypothetical protein
VLLKVYEEFNYQILYSLKEQQKRNTKLWFFLRESILFVPSPQRGKEGPFSFIKKFLIKTYNISDCSNTESYFKTRNAYFLLRPPKNRSYFICIIHTFFIYLFLTTCKTKVSLTDNMKKLKWKRIRFFRNVILFHFNFFNLYIF